MTEELFLPVLFGVTAILFVGPLLPSLYELLRPRAATPLPLRLGVRETSFFAQRFDRAVRKQFGAAIINPSPRLKSGALPNGSPYVLRGTAELKVPGLKEIENQEVQRVIISIPELTSPPAINYHYEVHCLAAFTGGEECFYQALYAGGPIRLGARSHVMRWLHSDHFVIVDEGCALKGRSSARTSMMIAQGCRFQRLQAPCIEFAPSDEARRAHADILEAVGTAFREAHAPGERQLHRSHVTIGAGEVVEGDLIAYGSITLGPGCQVRGSIKTHKDIVIGEGALIDGSVIAVGRATIGAGSWIRGPVIIEGRATMGKNAIVGTPDGKTTFTAHTLRVAHGVRLHGTLWAYRGGRVERERREPT